MENKPLIVIELDDVKYNVWFEHYSPKRITQENLERISAGKKPQKIRQGTTCTLTLGVNKVAYTFTGRSYVRADHYDQETFKFVKGDKFNGNLGMFRSLTLALDEATKIFPFIARTQRTVLFAELHNRITQEHGIHPRQATEMNWRVVVYDDHDNVLDTWDIQNRTEDQAEREASHDLAMKKPKYDTWTMTLIE